jgi:hypothetical protein
MVFLSQEKTELGATTPGVLLKIKHLLAPSVSITTYGIHHYKDYYN